LELVYLKTLNQFNHSYLKICGFSHFNQILLNLFNISFAFYNNIWFNIKTKMCQIIWTTQIQSWNAYETSNKSNKIWLKWLNSPILKDGELN